ARADRPVVWHADAGGSRRARGRGGGGPAQGWARGREAHGSEVGHGEAARRERRGRLVRERLADGGRRLGVVLGAEVQPRGAPAAAAEAALEPLQGQRRVDLVAAALAEYPADQRGGGD